MNYLISLFYLSFLFFSFQSEASCSNAFGKLNKSKIKNIHKLAHTGDPKYQFELAGLYNQGELFIKQNHKRAFKWYKAAAEQGYLPAQKILSVIYQLGLGTKPDSDQALKWLKEVALQGDAADQYELGHAYLYSEFNGKPFKKDYQLALYWFEQSSEQGNAKAQYEIGRMYFSQEKYKQALEWFSKAAEQGLPAAQHNLGLIHARVNKNYYKAFLLFIKAAKYGLPAAQHNLGFIYNYGWGVERNTHKALEWFERAAQGGLPEAISIVDRLRNKGEGKLAMPELNKKYGGLIEAAEESWFL